MKNNTKNITIKFIDLMNSRDPNGLADIIDANFKRKCQATEGFGVEINSRDQFIDFLRFEWLEFKESRLDFIKLIAEENASSGALKYTALSNNGNSLNFEILFFLEVSNGLVKFAQFEWDQLTYNNQSGKMSENQFDVNIFSRKNRIDPYNLFKILRSKDHLIRIDPGNFWAITRYDEIKSALKDTGQLSSEGHNAIMRPDWLDSNPISESILTADPPRHTRLREIISQSFGGNLTKYLEPHVVSCANQITASIERGKLFDFVGSCSFPFIESVIADTIGFPKDRAALIKKWLSLTSSITPIKPNDKKIQEINFVIAEFRTLIEDAIAFSRKEGGQSIVCHLISSKVDGENLSDYEITCFLFVLVAAAYETTVGLITACLIKLSSEDGLFSLLKIERNLLPQFIEEVLRYEPPLQGLVRLAKNDISIRDTNIKKGEFVILLLGSGNRDERIFENAEIFDIYRKQKGHLSFGHGPHMCIGAALARMEVRHLINSILDNFNSVHVNKEDITWSCTISTRTASKLPIIFD